MAPFIASAACIRGADDDDDDAGNLPYSATTEKIQQHFAKIQPMSVRHNTDKATGKSRGFAFLEFDAYDRMKTCLKLYHHSLFEDGKTEGRKINVELT